MKLKNFLRIFQFQVPDSLNVQFIQLDLNKLESYKIKESIKLECL